MSLDLFVDRWWSWIVPLSWQLAIWVALIAGLAWLARKASPQVRYLLWTLVLVKVFLPPSLAVNWGFGTWGLEPIWEGLAVSQVQTPVLNVEDAAQLERSVTPPTASGTETHEELQPRTIVFGVWLAGCVAMLAATLWQYGRLRKLITRMEPIDEGPVRIALEQLALQAGVRRMPEVLAADAVATPFLIGLWQPRIVLPRQLIEKLPTSELEGVLLHELNHFRRRDLWVGAVQAIVQGLLWFHPLVWWANSRLRQERECACDQEVLRQSKFSPTDYGQTLLTVLSVAKGRALYQANLVGVFEPGANVQQRLEEIMREPTQVRSNALWYVAFAGLLLVFLPMAAVNSATEPAKEAAVAAAKMPAWIVSTSPAIGATDVDPALTEIAVTFDRDMGGGMSWTGGPPLFPTGIEGAKAHWRDNRTCVLPVKLKRGTYYRVGINSKSHLNFRSAEGAPAPCTAVYFVTRGASKAIQSRVRVPKIVKLVPKNGATDVDPNLKAIRVTFDVPMGGGMSWTGGGENYPVGTGDSPKWSSDGKTCIMPVMLESGHEYELGINSLNHINFQSRWGVPVVPVRYQFTTAGESQTSSVKPGTSDERHLRALVEDFFKHNFRDVTQRKTIEWGPVETDAKGHQSIRYKYYASIWDKEVLIMNQVFTFDASDEYIGFVNVEGFPVKKEDGSITSGGQTGPSADQHLQKLVEKFFQNNFRDVTQRKTIEWGLGETDAKGNHSIRYKYYASIRDKELLVMNQVFTFDANDEYVGFVNVEGFPQTLKGESVIPPNQ